jgi:mannose-1-phosphate guanylyltransferase/mannose-6-phosphate isomerase
MSRRLLPKQFLPLVAENTLFQETVLRARHVQGCGAPLVVANAEHRFLAAEQLQAIGVKPGALILEPAGRNTAPAIAAAALHAIQADPEAILVVLPSDHLIRDAASFREALRLALEAAAQGSLVTFGIAPSHPATGYGYIEAGEPLGKFTFRIKRFVEKPDAEKAKAFLAQGGYLWNSGMFVFRASRFLEELGAQQPAIIAAVKQAIERAGRDLDFLRLDAESFAASPSLSVDYGVMEHTKSGAVVRAAMDWSDVGSWAALWDVGAKDANGNVVRGDVELRDAQGCYAHANARHVSLLGVKDLVERMARDNRSEHVSHSRVYRPWGYYEALDAGENFQVKRLMVLPGQALSLQMHHKRAEHWVVVSGRARVTRGEDVIDLERNQSTYIPAETKHRLENPGDEPLLVVEVQSGAYLGEDDIVRFEDRYKRE